VAGKLCECLDGGTYGCGDCRCHVLLLDNGYVAHVRFTYVLLCHVDIVVLSSIQIQESSMTALDVALKFVCGVVQSPCDLTDDELLVVGFDPDAVRASFDDEGLQESFQSKVIEVLSRAITGETEGVRLGELPERPTFQQIGETVEGFNLRVATSDFVDALKARFPVPNPEFVGSCVYWCVRGVLTTKERAAMLTAVRGDDC